LPSRDIEHIASEELRIQAPQLQSQPIVGIVPAVVSLYPVAQLPAEEKKIGDGSKSEMLPGVECPLLRETTQQQPQTVVQMRLSSSC
jgi:hypothetical protein